MVAGEDQVALTGGTLASAFDDLESLYNTKKDPTTGEWKTFVPVYEDDDCSNPNGSITVVGFATATITGVLTSPDKEIIARVECDAIELGRPKAGSDGAGLDFGTLGSIPALVS